MNDQKNRAIAIYRREIMKLSNQNLATFARFADLCILTILYSKNGQSEICRILPLKLRFLKEEFKGAHKQLSLLQTHICQK